MEYTDIDRKKDFDYFISNYEKLFQTYGHKFLAIKNETILGAFDGVAEAIDALKDKYEVGTYIIQECSNDESAYRTSIMRLQIRG